MDIITKIEPDESGVLVLKIGPVDPDDPYVELNNLEECSSIDVPVQWSDITFKPAGSPGNPNKNRACIFTARFNDLVELDYVYSNIFSQAQNLYIDDDIFHFKLSDLTCEDSTSLEKNDASLDVTVELPGRIRSHNADKQIGRQLTWNIPKIDCFEAIAQSELTPIVEPVPETLEDDVAIEPIPVETEIVEPAPAPNEPKKESAAIDSVNLWTTIGASVATILGTAIAFAAYTDSKKK